MARPMKRKETIRRKTIEDMESLGTYKKEYDPLINVYSDLMAQYLQATDEFEASGFEYETETAAGGSKKSAIVATLENLRKDLLAYSDRLCLNPKSIQSGNIDTPKKSKLASLLSEAN